MSEKIKKPPYRPTTYTIALRDEICARLASGETLRAICRDPNMPDRSTIDRWNIENRGEVIEDGKLIEQGFYGHYSRARNVGLDNMADDVIEISSTPVIGQKVLTYLDKDGNEVEEVTTGDTVDRSRLHVDSLKWYLSKMAPKRYGEARILQHQQLDAQGETVDPVAPVVIDLSQITKDVHEELAKILNGGKNDTEEPA
jgi:hypothetical protein